MFLQALGIVGANFPANPLQPNPIKDRSVARRYFPPMGTYWREPFTGRTRHGCRLASCGSYRFRAGCPSEEAIVFRAKSWRSNKHATCRCEALEEISSPKNHSGE